MVVHAIRWGSYRSSAPAKQAAFKRNFAGAKKSQWLVYSPHVQRLTAQALTRHQASAYLIRQVARLLGSTLSVSAVYVLSACGQERRQIRFA